MAPATLSHGDRRAAGGVTRRRALALAAGGAACLGFARPGPAQEITFFRIAAGGPADTYYPIGALIADVISNPPPARSCGEDGRCGVPGLVASALSSAGSIANVEAVASGRVESGLTQSDIAFWAYHGSGIFQGQPPRHRLRLIGNLYPEVMQIVVRRDAGIDSIPAMAGRRISLDVEGSGTLAEARILLASYGMTEADLEAGYLEHGAAVTRLREGGLDGFFLLAGYPTASVFDLIDEGLATLLAIPSERVLALLDGHPFCSLSVVPEGTYPGLGHVSTLAIGAQWVTTPDLGADLVYGITRALWHEKSRALLDSGHPAARQLKLQNALLGAAIPLHPGARGYYREAGLDLSHVPPAAG